MSEDGLLAPPIHNGTETQTLTTSSFAQPRTAFYRLYLTKDGRRGFPNELAATNRNFALRGSVVVLLRLYGIDPRADVSRPELEPWGYVPPARVSARVLGCVRRRREGLVRSV